MQLREKKGGEGARVEIVGINCKRLISKRGPCEGEPGDKHELFARICPLPFSICLLCEMFQEKSPSFSPVTPV